MRNVKYDVPETLRFTMKATITNKRRPLVYAVITDDPKLQTSLAIASSKIVEVRCLWYHRMFRKVPVEIKIYK